VIGETASVDREVYGAGEKILEAQEVDLPSIEVTEADIHTVEAELAPHTDAVSAPRDRDRIGQSGGEDCGVVRRSRGADHDAARSRRDPDQRKSGEGGGIGSPNGEIGVSHRLQGPGIVAIRCIADAEVVEGGRAEGVNVLGYHYAVVLFFIETEAGNVGSGASERGQSCIEGSVGEKELNGKPVLARYAVVDISIELVFSEPGDRRAVIPSIGAGRGNGELPVRQPGVEQR